MKCKFCGAETDQATVFGVMEKTHYDNRTTTADTDTGQTRFEAKALVRIPYCAACAKTVQHTVRKKYMKATLGFSAAAVVLIAIRLLIGSGGTDKTLIQACTFLGVITLIGAIVNLILWIKSAVKQGGTLEEHCIAQYTEASCVPGEDVLSPVPGASVILTPSKGSLSNRWSITYSPVSSKKLESIKVTKSSSGKNNAWNLLKVWFESDKAQLPAS